MDLGWVGGGVNRSSQAILLAATGAPKVWVYMSADMFITFNKTAFYPDAKLYVEFWEVP